MRKGMCVEAGPRAIAERKRAFPGGKSRTAREMAALLGRLGREGYVPSLPIMEACVLFGSVTTGVVATVKYPQSSPCLGPEIAYTPPGSRETGVPLAESADPAMAACLLTALGMTRVGQYSKCTTVYMPADQSGVLVALVSTGDLGAFAETMVSADSEDAARAALEKTEAELELDRLPEECRPYHALLAAMN